MRKVKNPKIGEYVLVTHWCDKDMNDPWNVGYLNAILVEDRGDGPAKYYRVEGSQRWFRHCWRISEEEGRERLEAIGL